MDVHLLAALYVCVYRQLLDQNTQISLLKTMDRV